MIDKETKGLTDRDAALRSKVTARSEREGYSNKTQILAKQIDMICATAAGMKKRSMAKDDRYTCKECTSAAQGLLKPT